MIAAPFIKFVGGKRALFPAIRDRLPAKIDTYYEPFVGGGAVFFGLASEKRFKSAVLVDSNAELMNTYAAVASETEALIRKLKEHPYEKTHYYAVRASAPRTPVAQAARFIYLNRSCFNGLYRVNKKGEFNVPFGAYTNPTICDEEGLQAAAACLKGARLLSGDFELAVSAAKKGDAVYCDPPYWPVSKTANFTAYGKAGFGPREQARLRDVAEQLVNRGVHVLLSNADVPEVRELYAKGFKIERVEAPRRVNSKGGKRGNVGELLISGGPL